ncbi:hypothetical protein Tco_0943870 [Tanacetum coccineum]
MFRRCSTMCLETPVISTGFQAKMSKLRWSSLHNLLWPSLVRVEPIITVCSGYSGFTATGNGYSQKDKNKAKTRQNQARDWKEHGKPKPKMCASWWANPTQVNRPS